jgi:8-oxo-dGTP pyrophosphatase MutT (NUDIX family)
MTEQVDLPEAEDAYRRRSARVLLVDAEDRVLLFRFWIDPNRHELGHCWGTPGGGVEKGEPLLLAAVRELREETGLVVDPASLGPHVAIASGMVSFDWATGLFRDDFFFHRTDGHQVDTSGFEDFEASQITEFRWWPVDELAATQEIVYPSALAALMADLIAGRIPEQPVRLPWHH